MAISGDHVIVKMDDSGGTPRQFDDGDIISVDLGQTFDQHDVAHALQVAQCPRQIVHINIFLPQHILYPAHRVDSLPW